MKPNLLGQRTTINRVLDGEWKRDRTAIDFGGASLTYGEVRRWAERIGDFLVAAGVKPGDRVGILSLNSLEWLPTYFAIARIGAIVVPLNIMLPLAEQSEIVRRSCPRLIFVDERDPKLSSQAKDLGAVVGRDLPVACARIDLDEVRFLTEQPTQLQRREDDRSALGAVRSGDVLQIMYTSGTTGLPKGVVYTHESALWNAALQAIDVSITAADTYMLTPSVCWAGGLHDFGFPVLSQGGTVLVMPSGATITELLDTIERRRPTITLLVPTLMKRLVSQTNIETRDLSSLRAIISGGEVLPVPVIEQFVALFPSIPLCQGWGMSEGPTIATLQEIGGPRKLGSVGHPLPFVEIAVVDASGTHCAPGIEGHILLRSPAAAIGYWEDEDATTQALSTDRAWFNTGDTGYLDEDGELFFLGRAKDMFVSGGLNVYPAEIETALLAHPDIREVAVVGEADEKWGLVGHAHLVLRDEAADARNALDLSEWLSGRIAKYKIPKKWTVRDTGLPRNASGKVVKTELARG
ncbi:class I adenylate-forming enzyme family protein [Acrocarpospora catenulata]|uniref:class I adenylate-forming enzyme family protein n=1 Tax=Acrocarpospora catenulata TaxID=2836182 RepID=UPI001BDB53A0|nr:class I adenylate-forming enzyme family protein [Acrocarpospora catenulata]